LSGHAPVSPARPPAAATFRLPRLLDPEAPPRDRFWASGLCGGLGLLAWLMSLIGAGNIWIGALLAAAFFFGGARTARQATLAVLTGQLDINLLMILAAAVSALLGYPGEGAMLLFLFSLSDALERLAIERTRNSVRGLMHLRPEVAVRVRGDTEETVPVDQLVTDDRVRIRPGDRFATDGVVEAGRSAVDESIITGEPLPVEKQPGAPIFAGTINASGALLVRVTRPASDSTLARIVSLIEQAQDLKPRAQRLIERYQGPYVGGVLGVSLLALLWHLLAGAGLTMALYSAMVVLVAASPCAVVLATPVGVLAAVTRAARHGVLFKGGAHLEQLARIRTIAFDKTGTITRGRPEVTSVRVFGDGLSEDEALARAAAVGRLSEHPLAEAIVRAAARRELSPPASEDFVSVAGLGMAARVEGHWLGVGRPELFEQSGRPVSAALASAARAETGETSVIASGGGERGAVISLRDETRPEAAESIEWLRGMGVRRLIMLTGDQLAVAQRIAEPLGFTSVHGGLRPEDKLREIHRLAGQNGGVAMVGDGVNDAPALAAATVGVAMGAAGTDVALENADVVLMRSDLRSLAEAVHVARHARNNVGGSLVFAFSVIVLLTALAVTGLVPLPIAVIGHEGSTVLVVLNGLRLLGLPSVASHASSTTQHRSS
jgi:Cd2+/Zn2+-exporting ATPase